MMNVGPDDIRAKAQGLAGHLAGIRRHIHSRPELSFQEFETTEFVENELRAIGLEPFRLSETGCLAILKGNGNGRKIALRADLDALPIAEANNAEYKSRHEGIMHACGHDVHTTCLLGAAKILHGLRQEWAGELLFIFQAGEEKLPGGASILIKNGLFERFPADYIIGQHVMPELETGKAGFRPGLYMASTDEVYVTVGGKGGHGAMPHQSNDVVLAASAVVAALQQVASRRAHPAMPTVLSICKFQAGTTTNVLPAKAELAGTLRTFNEEWRREAKQHISEIATATASAFGCTAEVNIVEGYPALVNHEGLTEQLSAAAQQLMGAGQVEVLELRPTAEDFAWYTQRVPGCFYRIGVGNSAKGITAPVHSPHFDIDEGALAHGAGLMAWLALAALQVPR